jgi:sugar phosphate isomerase/epimerase
MGYTSDEAALKAATAKTGSDGGTYIYDSLMEILDSMDSDIKEHFQTEAVNKAIIIITDGEDTESLATLKDVITEANRLDVPIHVIGLGKASESYRDLYQTDESNSQLIRDLQELASETRGFYFSVVNDGDLELLSENVGKALAAGHDQVKVTLDPVPEPGTVVKGDIGLIGSGSSESWSFVAP